MSRLSGHAEKVIAAVETYVGASALIASWRRCLQVHGLHPDRAERPLQDRDVWREGCERHRAMIEIGRPILDQLFNMLCETDCAILLTDHRGMVLDLRTNRACDSWNRKPDEWLGTTYSEPRFGTNGVGMCIADQRGVIVRGEHHFLTCFTNRNGIAAPLFGADGMLAGTISINQDIASHDARLDAFLSMTLANFARRIEAEMFARAYPRARLVLAAQGRAPDALLAVDPDDRVVGATRAARRLLSLCDDMLAGAPNVDALLDAPAAGRGDVLAEAERRTIVRALSRVGGNLSAAARLIGISRSTLYRKLASYQIGVPGAPQTSAKPRPSA